jgi:general secretion pathway protein B
MSFILDALRKAEHRNRDKHEMSVPTGPRVLIDETPEAPANWRNIILIGFVGLLLLFVGLFYGLRTNDADSRTRNVPISTGTSSAAADAPRAEPATTPSQATTDRPTPSAALNSQVPALPRDTRARALDREAARSQPRQSGAPSPGTVTREPPADPSISTPAPARVRTELLPDYLDVVRSGEVALPQLHLDMHVYSTQPQKRFVFINLTKARAGELISPNTLVESIEPDGVIVEYKGFRFILRPD